MTSARVILPFLLVLSGCGWFPDPLPEIPQRKPLDPDVVAILQAAAGGSLPKVQALVEKNPALVNAANYEGETPLDRAATGFGSNEPNVELVRFLLAHGANANSVGLMRSSPLHGVRSKEIAALLLDHGADLNAKDLYNRTPLDLCRWTGRREVCELLIARGAKISVSDAAMLGRTKELAQMLEVNPALGNSYDVLGWTPLHYAAQRDQLEAAKVLLKYGADPRKGMQVPRGMVARFVGGSPTPIDYAQEKGHTEMVRLLEGKSK